MCVLNAWMDVLYVCCACKHKLTGYIPIASYDDYDDSDSDDYGSKSKKRKKTSKESAKQSKDSAKETSTESSKESSKRTQKFNNTEELVSLVEHFGTKMGNMIHYLRKLWDKSEETRVIIFSQVSKDGCTIDWLLLGDFNFG